MTKPPTTNRLFVMLEFPDDTQTSYHRYTGNHDPGSCSRLELSSGLREHDVESVSKASLDKHVKAKHHAVRASKGSGQDHGDSLVSMSQETTGDEHDGEESISEDVARYVGGREDNRKHHEPIIHDVEFSL
jgi:hypothetical protein